MNHLYITETAARNMRSLSKQVTTETGGVLVGTLTNPTILAAGNPGPDAVKTFSSFSSDAAHDKAFLNQTRQKLGQQVKYLGHWHKHPSRMTSPSGGDLNQAQELLRTLTQLGESQPTLLCVILQDVANDEEAIFPYVLDGGHTNFRKLAWSLVADDSSEVKEALRLEPQGISATDATHPWVNPNFRFQNTPVGLARLEKEKTAIERMGYTVTVRSRVSDRRVFFELQQGNEALVCIFPPEFPLGAPRLIRISDATELSGPRSGFGWNSDMQVAELLASIKQLMTDPEKVGKATPCCDTPNETEVTAPTLPDEKAAPVLNKTHVHTLKEHKSIWIVLSVILVFEFFSLFQRNRR